MVQQECFPYEPRRAGPGEKESPQVTLEREQAAGADPKDLSLPAQQPDFDVRYVLDAVQQMEERSGLRVAAYIRVSTDLQDQENSYVAQEQHFYKKITSNPRWEFVGVYSDYGLSGTGTADRVGFRRLIRHCKEGKIDRILCKSISRFARNTADFSQTILLLRSLHITILFEKENLDSAELQNEFILSVLGAFAQEESRSISSNIKEGIRMHRSQGNVPNAAMYGYRYTGNWLCTESGYAYREIEPVQEEAEVVQTIYRNVAEGHSFAEIARKLNAQGVAAPDSNYNRARKACARKGQLNSELDDGWKALQISGIVRNERYAGDVLTQKTYTPDYLTHKVRVNQGELRQYYIRDHHPAIVERELYETVQRVLEQRQKNRRRQNKKCGHPFDRRVLCAACGRFYCGAVKSGTHIWYCPTAARNNGLCLCRAENIPEETLVFALCAAVFRDYGLDRTLLFAKPDGAIAGQGPSDVQTGEKLRTLFYSIQQRLEKILNDVYVERDRSRYKRQLAVLEKAMEQDAAERMRRNGELSTELENRCQTDKRQYEELAAKLDTLEEYWNELECDHALRAEALQWVRALPRNRNGLQEFLHGITGRYFRAFVLDLTVYPQGTYKVRWFDDRSTEVNRKDRAEEENADG